VDSVVGDATGVEIPAHPDALRAAGAAFLTRPSTPSARLPKTNPSPGTSMSNRATPAIPGRSCS